MSYDELQKKAEEEEEAALLEEEALRVSFPPPLLFLGGSSNVLQRPELCTSGPYLCFDSVCDVSTVFPTPILLFVSLIHLPTKQITSMFQKLQFLSIDADSFFKNKTYFSYHLKLMLSNI